MAVTFSLSYHGDLRCEARHEPSGTTLITDAPLDNQGRGESFSPTDLVATGLGVCMFTIMGIVAKRDGIALAGATARVEKHMTSTPPRRIERIVVRFALPAAIPAEDRAKLERAAHTCPVALSLHPDVVQDVAFAYA
jgi:putative redox protein